MKLLTLLGGVALAGLTAGSAWGGTIFTVYGYNLPVAAAFNSVTTNGYSYYTGPFVLSTSIGNMTVYCADLEHLIYNTTYTYAFGQLTQDGVTPPSTGQLSQAASNEIGDIAVIGGRAFGTGDYDMAVAAQAAIWDVEYGTTSSTANVTIAGDIAALLNGSYPEPSPYSHAIIPYGYDWPYSGPQQLIPVPEASAWAMMALGFAGLALAGYRRTRQAIAIV